MTYVLAIELRLTNKQLILVLFLNYRGKKIYVVIIMAIDDEIERLLSRHYRVVTLRS